MSERLPPSFEGMPYAALRRYVSGASDAAERRRVEAWAAASGARRTYLAALIRTWHLAEAEGGLDAATEAAWAALSARLEVPPGESRLFEAPWEAPAVEIDVRRRPARRLTGVFDPRRRWLVIPAAAAAVLIAALGTFLLGERARRSTPHEATLREVATRRGQRAEVRLGDGSSVSLGVASRLRFPAAFGAKARELELEGEAYFVVVHDTTRPFVVRAAGSKTIDLGTAFLLRAYPTDGQVQVVVAEGSVALGADRLGAPAATVLTQGRMGRLAKGAAVPVVRAVDPSAYTSWLHDRLTFLDTPLDQVALDLGRWYSVEVRLADSSLARETFSASFAADSFSEALRTVTTVLHLRAERRGKTVVLHRLASPPHSPSPRRGEGDGG